MSQKAAVQDMGQKNDPHASLLENPDVAEGRKRFIPLENNPDVMTALVHKLGVSQNLSFHDVFSIDDSDLLAFVPRPALALLLVFPVSSTYEKYRLEEDSKRPFYEGKGEEEPVIWYRQTIGNACGLMGLLHAVSNGPARDFVGRGTDLSNLINDAIPLAPVERANLLYNSEALEHAHQGAAVEGQSSAPAAEDHVDLHYVAFVKDTKTNHLWELDGRRTGPLDRGELGPDDDVLSERALDLSVRPFMKRESGEEMRFSIVALAPSLD